MRTSSCTRYAGINTYAYNSLGDRLQSTLDGVTTTCALDLNAGLTQVLEDGVNTYVYGYTRLAQVSDTDTGCFLTDALGSVRQARIMRPRAFFAGGITDATGAISLVRSYSPYGETTQSLGDFQTDFSFTGEMTDASGLVFLRARYYDPATGRFVSRDTWEGEYQNPLSLNKWNYTEENPINRIDPIGHYWWGPGQALWETSTMRLQSQNVHVRIQALAMEGQSDIIHAEYPIPPMGMKVDLLNSYTGEVWEIKPWADLGQAPLELAARIINLEAAKNNSLLHGMNPIAMPYNWNEHPRGWIEGFSFTSEQYVGADETGQYEIWAGQVSPGVIAWWKYKKPNPVTVLVPILLPYAMRNSERNTRPNWSPNTRLNPQPAYSINYDSNEMTTTAGVLIAFYLLYKAAEFCVFPPLVLVTP